MKLTLLHAVESKPDWRSIVNAPDDMMYILNTNAIINPTIARVLKWAVKSPHAFFRLPQIPLSLEKNSNRVKSQVLLNNANGKNKKIALLEI